MLVTLYVGRDDAAVNQVQVVQVHMSGAEMLQQVDEGGVALPVNLLELDFRQRIVLQAACLVEEPAVGSVDVAERELVLRRCDREQLEQVAHKDHLDAAERLEGVAVVTEHPVDTVDDVTTDHGHLINDDGVDFLDQRDLGGIHLAHIPGAEDPQAKTEERVDGLATGVNGGHSRWSKDHKVLVHAFLDLLQEGGFTCPGAAGQEETVVGLCNEIVCIAHFLVLEVEGFGGDVLCFHSFSVWVMFFSLLFKWLSFKTQRVGYDLGTDQDRGLPGFSYKVIRKPVEVGLGDSVYSKEFTFVEKVALYHAFQFPLGLALRPPEVAIASVSDHFRLATVPHVHLNTVQEGVVVAVTDAELHGHPAREPDTLLINVPGQGHVSGGKEHVGGLVVGDIPGEHRESGFDGEGKFIIHRFQFFG